jgi:hypothetical protein
MNTILIRCASALLLAGTLSALTPPAWAQAAPDDALTFAAAMQAYQDSHWPQSYALLVQLADRGHAEASRIAGQMHRWGPRLYGQRFAASADQLARWQLQARCGGGASAPSCGLTAKAP